MAKAPAKAAVTPAEKPAEPKSDKRVDSLQRDVEAIIDTMRRNGWTVHR